MPKRPKTENCKKKNNNNKISTETRPSCICRTGLLLTLAQLKKLLEAGEGIGFYCSHLFWIQNRSIFHIPEQG